MPAFHAAALLSVALIAAPSIGGAAANGAITIGQQVISPGEQHKFGIIGGRSFEGAFVDFPVFAARGTEPGPVLCVTSAIHGDEVNSVEIARQAFAGVDPKTLRGTLIVMPAINSWGFRTANRYMSDRRDLNRAFPGSPNGSVAAIVAAAVFDVVGRHCTHLVDLHTGSNFRTNLPQIRVDTKNAKALELARAFGTGVIVNGAGPDGSLRREAMKAGVVSVIYEAGPPYVFQRSEIEQGVAGIRNVMRGLGMVEGGRVPSRAQMLRNAAWVRVPRGHGGVFMPSVRPGDTVTAQATIATIADPLSDEVFEVRAPRAGIVVGMALPQVVLSGYGLFHIGELVEVD